MNVEILKNKMKEKNISIYRLSKITGLNDTGIGRIIGEKKKNPQIETIVKIAYALDLTNDEFIKLCGYKSDENE
ncbi:helix-turn-helix transcriptional regulator [Erysipelatoclostridium sp. An15]|uniref:helix-turn-helix domain-containing protein n=1 Tax=Erysipelatoclostridium sp. An15 TaxID=1965566 RepID=UPI001EF50FED|nr:helix-turn-helix transcriptional regulator [Erysipelatoclostridium sp. An15]